MRIGYLMQAGVPDVRKSPLSGPANHVKLVFEELGKLGHQVRLLACLDGQIWKSDDLRHYEAVSVCWMDHGPLRLFERVVRRIQYELKLPYAALFESTRFALACRQELAGYNLLYERMGWFGYGGGLAARWMGIPLILEVNGDHLTEMEMRGITPRGAQRWLSIALMQKAISAASHVVATGEGWRNRFVERWTVDPAKVTVVENGSELVPLLQRNQLRAFCSNPDPNQPATIVYLGGFDPWQGVNILIRAVGKAIARQSSVRLVLIGSGSELKTAQQLVSELELSGYVTCTGDLTPPQYANYLAAADIGASPYCGRVEYSGLKLIDYKAAGLAIVASGSNSQPAIIDHGRTGWIVPPCDEEALCQAIVRLCSDIELRQRMGQAARIEAEQMHGWDKTAAQLNQLFVQAVGDRSNGNK